MTTARRLGLAEYLHGLLAEGRTAFTAEEAEAALGVGHGAFLDSAGRLQRRKALIHLRQGFYVAVPPQYASWGAPPPSWYIDALMQRHGVPYYVGLLKAAELHGATHQAVMEFQLVSGRRLARIRAGRSRIVFYYRKDMAGTLPGVEDHQTDTGQMKVSSPELTALDLLRYPWASGGIDNIATVLQDMQDRIDPHRLAALSATVEGPILQRLGYLLDCAGCAALAGPLHQAWKSRGAARWTRLEWQRSNLSDILPNPAVRDTRWRVVAQQAPVPEA